MMERIHSYSCVSVSSNGNSSNGSSGSSSNAVGITGSAAAAAVSVWRGFLSSSLQAVIFGASAALTYSLLQQQRQQQHNNRSGSLSQGDNKQHSKSKNKNTLAFASDSNDSNPTIILSQWFLFLPPFSRRVLQPVADAVLHAARRGYQTLLYCWSLPLTLRQLSSSSSSSSSQQRQQRRQRQRQPDKQQRQGPQHHPSESSDPPPLWFWLGMSWWVRLLFLSNPNHPNHPGGGGGDHSSMSMSMSSNSFLQRLGLVPAVQNILTTATLLFSGYYYYHSYSYLIGDGNDGDDDDDLDNNNNNNNSDNSNHIFRNHHPSSHIYKQHDSSSSSTNTSSTNTNTGHGAAAGNRQHQHQHGYLELLVHNVSHTDLILSLDTMEEGAAAAAEASTSSSTSSSASASASASEDPYCFARPRFSCFDMYSRRVLAALQAADSDETKSTTTTTSTSTIPTMDFHRYQRSYENDTGTEVPSDETIPRYCQKGTDTIPVGLVLSGSNNNDNNKDSNKDKDNSAFVGLEELNDLRIRGRDQAKLAQRVYREHDSGVDTDATAHLHLQQQQQQQSAPSESIAIRHVFFPLLASLLPRWKEQIEDKRYNAKSPVKRVLILVSGVGTPRNWTHAMAGNSTQACADLMELFLQKIDPELTVIKIHSDSNIFRYDENLLFMERQLLPTVNAYRDAHAYQWPYPDEQTAGVQHYSSNPNMGVMPLPQSTQAASFNVDWHKSFALTLSFADGSPARTYAIQASLRPYRPTYFHFWQLKTFWHESKIVDDDLEVHSFEEMETSPAVDATRCTDPMIQAVVQEIKAFSAEMSRTQQQGNHDLSKFWLRKTHKPVLAVLLVQSPGDKEPKLYRGTNMEVSMPTGSLCAERNVIGTALAANPALKREDLKLIAVLAVQQVEEITTSMKRSDSNVSLAEESVSEHSSRKPGSEAENHLTRKTSLGSEQEVDWVLPPEVGTDSSFTILDAALDKQQCGECGVERSDSTNKQEATESTPVRRIKLFSKSTNARKSKRTVIVQSTKDLNPLRPCGACNEWLKKIAEPNPYFRILTFTDAGCNGVYITPCQE